MPDSFKGTLTSAEAGEIIKTAFCEAGFPRAAAFAVSDGGDGAAEAIFSGLGGEKIAVSVMGPLFTEVCAEYLLFGKSAFIESASCYGLGLVPEQNRDVMNATTFGVGQMILHALARGAETVLVGLGGSAGNDGGAGCAAALGVRFYNAAGRAFIPTGRTLADVFKIDFSNRDKRLVNTNLTALCDVANPFYGKNGAARVFAKQKGASAEEIKRLDEGLRHLAGLITHCELQNLPGSGAAGGLGGGIAAFLGGTLKSGFDVFASLLGLSEKIKNADLVITGEGKTDFQTLSGKLPAGVAALCKKHGKPCLLISGCIQGDMAPLYEMGITAAYATVPSAPKRTPDKAAAAGALYKTAQKAARDVKNSAKPE